MWYFVGEIIKTPKVMVISDVTHPPGIFRDSAMLTSLGIKPYSEVTSDSRYYTRGAYSVDTSGDEVVGTYAGTAKDIATLKTNMLGVINEQVKRRLTAIDWYWARADKGGTAVPSAISTYATTIYSEQATKESEVAALDTLAKIIEYEGRAYTEVRKDLKADGTYHASDTTSYAKKINMLEHWTASPDDEVDAGQVSLTAD